jgi:hypothetical protein
LTYLTHKSFLEKVDASNSKYWQEGKNYRWQYMGYCIEQLKTICPDDSKLIEAGTSGMPLSDRSYLFEFPKHNLDIFPYMTCGSESGDLCGTIPDKYFDCFVALQVWEHLDNQERAFKEVMRISKSAILSFPYMWPKGKGHDARHIGIDDRKIKQWTCGVKPEKTKLINNRMVYVWKF